MDLFLQIIKSDVARKIGSFILVVTIVLVLSSVVKKTIKRQIDDNNIRYRAQKGVTFISYVIVLAAIVSEFGGKSSGLTVALGAGSAGVAFALQEVIASFAGWIAIAAGGFYGVGDRVQVGGIKGDVIDVGLLRTTLMELGGWVDGDLYNGRIVRVANSFVFKEPVFNYSRDFPFLWDEIKVPVKYGSDYKRARQILEGIVEEETHEFNKQAKGRWAEVVRQFSIENARIDPMVTLIANDNWVEFTVRYIVEVKGRRGMKDRLFDKILEQFDATEGRVAFASMTVHLVETPTLDVRILPIEAPVPAKSTPSSVD
ncbi:MAG: mechanosensitive ion channel [Deltaproteobacteria bacterium]|nr:mechanosensitive ion channel [Deltaproteobacteria bacterium]